MPTPQEEYIKVYVSSETAKEIAGDLEATGESFWAKPLTANTAEIRNICLCGLGVGDIVFLAPGPKGQRRDILSVKKKVCKVYGFNYTFEGMEKTTQFPKNVADYVLSIEKMGMRFESMMKGIALIQRPLTMTEEDFLAHLENGPIKFSQ